jgi:hypothetical protein
LLHQNICSAKADRPPGIPGGFFIYGNWWNTALLRQLSIYYSKAIAVAYLLQMKFSKPQMFLLLNGFIALFLLFFLGIWLFGKQTRGRVIPPFKATKITAVYVVDGNTYKASYMRNDISFMQDSVQIIYLPFSPSSSRINSFMGIAAEPLAWWLVFLMASAMLFFTDNVVYSKGTVFRAQKKFPWIIMEEYFKLPWYYRKNNDTEAPVPEKKNQPPRLKGH